MKILVIEDSSVHQEAARKQLANHEVKIMKSFVEFFDYVEEETGGREVLTSNIDRLKHFDMVLTDINLPSPHDIQGTVQGATGFVIALKAMQAGVKYIGIITDANHHQDVYGKALDLWIFQGPFTIGETRVCLECFDATTSDEIGDRVKNWEMMADKLIASS